MRIGVLTTSYPAREGDAAGSFVRGFARWLARQGAEVEVLAPRRGPDGDPNDAGIRVERVGMTARVLAAGVPEALERSPWAWPSGAAAAAALSVAAWRRHRRWDALVSHWLLPCGALAAALAGGRRHLAIAHSGDVHLALRLGLAPALARLLSRTGADTVFVSDALRAGFLAAARASALPARVVAMGTDAGPPPDPRERAATRAALGVTGVVVGVLARLVPIKNVGGLIDAARRAGVTLLIAGDGPERAALHARAAGSARFLGALAQGSTAWRGFFGALDLLCVPSIARPDGRTEGTPVVIAEAIAHGVPVLGCDSGGIAAAIGGAGLAVAPSDLAQTLRSLAGSPRTLMDLRNIAIARAPSVSWDRVGDTLASALLQNGNGPVIVQRVNRVGQVTAPAREEADNRCSAISTSTVPSWSPSGTTKTSSARASGRSRPT